MLHIGVDFHKRFSRVVALDDAGSVVDRRTLRHNDRDGMVEYFRDKSAPEVRGLGETATPGDCTRFARFPHGGSP